MSQCLYRHFDETGALLYVGITNHIGRRSDQHAKHSGWFDAIAKIEVERFVDRAEALKAERAAIGAERPKFNIQHRYRDPPPRPPEISERQVTRSVVFKPLYTPATAAELLGLSQHMVRNEIAEGRLGHIILESIKAKHPKTFISGWQIIDWLENHVDPAP